MDFAEDPRREISINQSCRVSGASYSCITLLEVRDSSYLGILSIFGPGKEGFSFKGLLGEEKLDFRVMLDVSLHRQTEVRLGKGVNLPTED